MQTSANSSFTYIYLFATTKMLEVISQDNDQTQVGQQQQQQNSVMNMMVVWGPGKTASIRKIEISWDLRVFKMILMNLSNFEFNPGSSCWIESWIWFYQIYS